MMPTSFQANFSCGERPGLPWIQPVSRSRPVESLEIFAHLGVEEFVVGIADIAAQPAFARQLLLDRRAVIGKHPAEPGRGCTVAGDGPQELQIVADQFEAGRGVEQHEAEFIGEADLLQDLDRADVLRHGDLLVEGDQPFLAAGFQAHIDEIEAAGLHLPEELGVHRIGAAIDLPDHPIGEIGPPQLLQEAARPALPDLAEEREVVVLEQEDADVVLVVEIAHLARRPRRACACARPCPGPSGRRHGWSRRSRSGRSRGWRAAA